MHMGEDAGHTQLGTALYSIQRIVQGMHEQYNRAFKAIQIHAA